MATVDNKITLYVDQRMKNDFMKNVANDLQALATNKLKTTSDEVRIMALYSIYIGAPHSALVNQNTGAQNWSERRCADDVVTIVLGIIFLLSSFSGHCFSTRKKAARVLNFCMGS